MGVLADCLPKDSFQINTFILHPYHPPSIDATVQYHHQLSPCNQVLIFMADMGSIPELIGNFGIAYLKKMELINLELKFATTKKTYSKYLLQAGHY